MKQVGIQQTVVENDPRSAVDPFEKWIHEMALSLEAEKTRAREKIPTGEKAPGIGAGWNP